MSTFLLQVVAGVALAGAPLPVSRPLGPSTSLTIERLELGAGPGLALSVDSLGQRIGLRVGSRKSSWRSRLCPHESRIDGWVYLECSTRRFNASLDPVRGTLDLIELRGVPFLWDDSGPPRIFYDPAVPGAPLSCPGSTQAAAAECALRAGDHARATQIFGETTEGPALHFAQMRLGDLAEIAGDPEQALAHYEEASEAAEPLKSLVLLRRCELLDACDPELLRPGHYGAAFLREGTLRLARYHAFHQHPGQMLGLLAAEAGRPVDPETPDAQRLLHRLIGVGLAASDDDDQARALELYLALPDRTRGPDAARLARMAAETASRLGVPRFGAHLLAAVFPEVAPAERADHLLRTAELYLADGDLAHAEAILDFAQSRIPARDRASPRWRLAERQVAAPRWRAGRRLADRPAPPSPVTSLAQALPPSLGPTP